VLVYNNEVSTSIRQKWDLFNREFIFENFIPTFKTVIYSLSFSKTQGILKTKKKEKHSSLWGRLLFLQNVCFAWHL